MTKERWEKTDSCNLSSENTHRKKSNMVNACYNLSTWKGTRSEIQSGPQHKFKVSLGYLRPYIRNKMRTTRKKANGSEETWLLVEVLRVNETYPKALYLACVENLIIQNF